MQQKITAVAATLRRFHQWRSAIENIGLKDTLRFMYSQHFRSRWGRADSYVLQPGFMRYPLRVRHNTSDLKVYRQIYLEREYSCLDDVCEVGLVIDCGGNVGYSSAYFLARWPISKVVVVEPDELNFLALQENLAPYGKRATIIRAGLWSHECELKLVETAYRDGCEWSRQVQECNPGEQGVIRGVDVDTLLRASGHERISILKIDIEGAEAIVFSARCDWLDRVDTLLIELHDDSHFGSGTAAFTAAIKDRGFVLGRSGELTICRRRTSTE